MDLLLVAWAIFLRDIGFVEKQGATEQRPTTSQRREGGGGTPLKLDNAKYKSILERELDEERSIAETDGKLGSMLDKLILDLRQLRTSVEPSLKTSEEAKPSYEDMVICQLIDDLELKVEKDREYLARRDKALLVDLEEKLKTLRSLEARLVKQKTTAQTVGTVSTLQPQQAAPWSVSADVVDMVQGSAIPVGFFLASTLIVTWLSQQFLRVATDWRRERWYKAERVRKVQFRRLRRFQDTAGHLLDELARGHLPEARKDFDDLVSSVGKVAAEPTWEEVVRVEAAAFWERWGPGAFQLEAVLPGAQEAPAEEASRAQWVVERWWLSAQSVVKDTVTGALTAWAKADEKRPEAAEAEVEQEVAPGEAAPAGSGLVIRIFGRWPQQAEWARQTEWVNIANLPLAGDWREKALRLLIPAEQDVKDLPVLGPLCEFALTAIVTKQVRTALTTNVWGGLTTDLWSLDGPAGSHKAFQIGYEVVEVASEVPEDMRALALKLPCSGTPGRVVPVEAGLESQEEDDEK